MCVPCASPLGLVTEPVYLLLSCLHPRRTVSATKVQTRLFPSHPQRWSAWHTINICWWMNVLEDDDLNSDLTTDSDLGLKKDVSPF